MNMQAAAHYRQGQILSCTPAETVLMLYQGAIRFLRSAIKEIAEKRNIAEKARLIKKTLSIIEYLQSCLDKEKGGEIAKNLDGLYEYMLIRLTEANLKNDEDKIEEVVKLLLLLTEAWAEICSETNGISDHQPDLTDQTSSFITVPETEQTTKKIQVHI